MLLLNYIFFGSFLLCNVIKPLQSAGLRAKNGAREVYELRVNLIIYNIAVMAPLTCILFLDKV